MDTGAVNARLFTVLVAQSALDWAPSHSAGEGFARDPDIDAGIFALLRQRFRGAFQGVATLEGKATILLRWLLQNDGSVRFLAPLVGAARSFGEGPGGAARRGPRLGRE